MKFVVKFFPEILMKSRSVRKRFCKMLQGNIRNVLRRYDEDVKVILEWDHIIVKTTNDTDKNRAKLIELLSSTPGVAFFLEVQQSTFEDLHDIYEQVLPVVQSQLAGKSFCVRVKRRGQHDFSSTEIERYVGGGLNQNTDALRVQLTNPDITIQLEVAHQELFIVKQRHDGLGGFPMGSQEGVLSLISGGFDSGTGNSQ